MGPRRLILAAALLGPPLAAPLAPIVASDSSPPPMARLVAERISAFAAAQAPSAQPPSTPAPPLPSPDELLRRVHRAVRLDAQLQTGFTYREHRRDIKISRLGKVTIGPLRTFEVHPSDQPGKTYKRLIAVEGTPLTADEIARRDAEHQRDLQQEAERERTASSRQRAREMEEQRDREAILADALAVFSPVVVGRADIDGQPVIVADVTARQDARVTTREGRWMKQFAGRVWVAEGSDQVVKLDMRALDDISIGWGVVGRVHRGTRVAMQRRWFEGVWLPASTTYEARGKTLLFRPFEFSLTTTYSDYKRRTQEAWNQD